MEYNSSILFENESISSPVLTSSVTKPMEREQPYNIGSWNKLYVPGQGEVAHWYVQNKQRAY